MNKEMFISSSPHETKVAVCEDGQLVEVYFERDTDVGLVGGIYKGRVSRVLPGMQSAFVDIGLERDAFLYVSDFSLQDEEDLEGALTESQGRRVAIEIEPQADQSSPVPVVESPPSQPADSGPTEISTEAPTTEAANNSGPEPSKPASEAATAEAARTSEVSHGPRPQGEEPGFRHRSRRGRRRRHGRGGFGDRRIPPHSERQTAPEKPEAAPSSGFEILPGESLAKYRHPDSGSTAHEEAAAESARTETSSFESTEAGSITSNSHAETHDVAEFSSEENDRVTNLENQAEEIITESKLNLSLSMDSVFNVSSTPSAIEESLADEMDAAEPAEEDEESASADELAPDGEETDEPEPGSESPSGSLSGESQPEIVSASSEAPSTEAEPADKASAAPESNQESAGRSVTLREPHAHPRFAPRRNRRGRRRMGRNSRRQSPQEAAARPASQQQGLQIAELLKEGQEIIVQIAKEPLGTKGARITSHVALPGRYLVYMPTISHIGVSRKIASEQERLRLRNLIVENRGPLTGGFIVRTACEGRSDEDLKADLKFLTTLWNDVRGRAERAKAPALLYRDLDLAQRLLRDLLTADFKSVWLDNESEYARVVDFVNHLQPSLVNHVKLHTRETPLYDEHGIQAEIEKALRPKVWLKSGGYIVINQTEALVAIDVNTGKYVGKTNRLEDTIVKTNIDAVNEIVRQIRLRDLGGIIVIDFIDMDERRNRNKVVQALAEALGRDRAPTKVLSFNDFGLVAVTRKRVKQSLERTLCDPCPYCNSAGWVKSVSTVCYEILAEARRMASEIEGKTITLRVNPDVALALKSKDGTLISEIESLTHKNLVIKSDATIHQERFEIF